MDQIDYINSGDIKLASEILGQELYSVAKLSDGDYLGDVKNALQWCLIGLEKAEKRLDETIQLGHKVDLMPWQMLEKIDDAGAERYMLTERIDRPLTRRRTLGIFDNLDQVREYLCNA
jgi:hypothetical protein